MGGGVDSRGSAVGSWCKLRKAVFPLVLINAYSAVRLTILKQFS